MATQPEVREIAMRLPGVQEGEDRFSFYVMVKGKPKGFLWTWAERVHPKKPKVINEGVVALSVPNQLAKEVLIGSDPLVFFSEPHYDGYNAVLVRLDAISAEELAPLIREAWLTKAPPELRSQLPESDG